MPPCCAVRICSEKKGGHRFPKDKVLLKKWLIAIRRDTFIPSQHARVCKKHFNPDDYELPKGSHTDNPNPRLKQNAVPSRFAWNQKSEERKKIKSKHAERAIQCQNEKKTATLPSYTAVQAEDYFIGDEICEEIVVENSNNHVSTQCSLCKCNGNRLTNPAALSERESDRKKINMFEIENLKNNPDIIQFYTGFKSYKHFMYIFNLFGDEVNNLEYYRSLQSPGNHGLTPCNQFYLTLIKLRRNMCYTELSIHFKISKTSVRNYFITWINYLYCKFKDLQVWVPKKIIDQNFTIQRKTNTGAVDCTKTRIAKFQNSDLQEATNYNYKSNNTLKVLIGISSSGSVTYVSDAYGGSISDQELFEKCGIDQLQKDDSILVDRGCDNQDLISHIDATVNKLQILKNTSNGFETHQFRTSKRHTPEQTNVKRVIGLEKTFKILSHKLGPDLGALGESIIFVCFMLSNFRKNIKYS